MKVNAAGDKNNDYILLRFLCLMGAVMAPIIKFVWSHSIGTGEFFLNRESVLQCILYSGTFLLLFASTFFVPFIKKNAYFVLYALYFLAFSALLYAAEDNSFSAQSIMLMLLFMSSITMVVKRMEHLLIFDLITYSLILYVLFRGESAILSKTFLAFFYLFYYIFNYGFAKMKLRTQNALLKSEQDYRTLVEITPQAIFVCRKDRILYCNSAAVTLAGAPSAGQLVNQEMIHLCNYHELIPEDIPETFPQEDRKPKYKELKFTRLDGTDIDVEINATHVKIEGKPAVLYIVKDISERKAEERKIQQMAFYDPLTGLPNRFQLNKALEEIIQKSLGTKQENAVLFADLDGFKYVNDTMGHANGDILLQQVSERMINCVRTGDIVSRYGGDEFVILLNGSNRANAHMVAQRILNSFLLPFNINGNDMYITPSIGVSLHPKDGETVSALIKNADSAMYTAKERGKNNFHYYSGGPESNPEPCLEANRL